MAGCIRVDQRIVAICDLTTKPLLTSCKKVSSELRAALDQTLADNPNTMVIGMTGGDFPVSQFGKQPTKGVIVHPIIIKEYQHVHIAQIKALADFFTEGLVHFVSGFELHIPIVVVLPAQRDSEAGPQFCIYNLLELCC